MIHVMLLQKKDIDFIPFTTGPNGGELSGELFPVKGNGKTGVMLHEYYLDNFENEDDESIVLLATSNKPFSCEIHGSGQYDTEPRKKTFQSKFKKNSKKFLKALDSLRAPETWKESYFEYLLKVL